MTIEVRYEKGFPKTASSLKEGDVFFVDSDKNRVFQVLNNNYVHELTSLRNTYMIISDFMPHKITVVRKSTLLLEV